MSTLLPTNHRRLRHVIGFTCRHVPFGTKSSHDLFSQFTLRDVAPEGGPGDVIYESEFVAGIHPTWTSIPESITLERFPNIQRVVFSLYRVSHSGSAAADPPATQPPVSDETRERAASNPSAVERSQAELESATTAIFAADSSNAVTSPVFPEASLLDSSTRPSQGLGTSPSTTQQLSGPTATTNNNNTAGLGAPTTTLLFEFLMDLTSTEYVAKNYQALHDVSHIPAHLEDGQRSFTVLIKCHDGVFFPTMESSSSLTAHLPVGSPQPPITINAKLARAAGSVMVPQSTTEWDMVDDADVARDAWERAQGAKIETMTLGDMKTLAASAITLKRLDTALRSLLDARKAAVDADLAGRAAEAQRHASATASDHVVDVCRAKVQERRALIATLRESNARKRNELQQREMMLRENSDHLRKSPTEAELECDEDVIQKRNAARQVLQERRFDLSRSIAQMFTVSSSSGTICGVRLPPNDPGIPEQAEHALALSHVCHAVLVFARVFQVSLPHPIVFALGRSSILERCGLSEDKSYPLFPGKASERALLRRGVELLRQDVYSAAYQIHHQKQADGLPLVMALEKLLLGR